MPIPFQEPLQSPTSETTPYPLGNPSENLTTETESTETLDADAPRNYTGGKLPTSGLYLLFVSSPINHWCVAPFNATIILLIHSFSHTNSH